MDSTGRVQEVVRESLSEEALAHELNAIGLYPLSIRPTDELGTRAENRFPRKAVSDFTATLSILIDSGLSVRDALDVCRAVFTSGPAARLVDTIGRRLKRGDAFHDVIDGMPRSFPPVYRGLVRIGERVGTLDNVVKQLSRYLADDKKLKDKIYGSLLYPALVLGVAFASVIGIIVIVLPKIRVMLLDLSRNNPVVVNHILGSVTGMVVAGVVALLTVAAGAAVLYSVRRVEGATALVVDRLLLRTPFLGGAILRSELFLFSFAMEILTSSGVTVEDGLAESAQVLTNHVLRREVLRIRKEIEQGGAMSESFLKRREFPEQFGRWIAVGERIGSVERVFGQLQHYYQAEVEKWTTRFMSLLEPGLIVLVGCVVLYLVFTFIIPIFNLFGSIV